MFRTTLVGALLLGAVSARSALGAIPASESQALRALYDATGGSNWTNKTGWLGAPGTECSWAGVQCNGNGTNVTRLYLYGNNLVGTLPDLRNLTKLEVLTLNGNTLKSLPAELGSLPSLTELDIAGSGLSGSIPSELGNLSSLTVLDLSGNALTGTIPATLGNLSKLTSLDLTQNQLSGSIPTSLSRLSALKNLYLGGNGFTGGIPRELGALAALENLSLRDNSLGGSIPPELGNLKSLQLARLYNVQLTGSIPAALQGLLAVTELDLSNNQLTGSIPPELGRLTTLVNLYLNGNQLTGTIPAALGGLKQLVSLSLYSNALTGPIPTGLGALTKLETLYLGYNKISGAVPADFGAMAALKSLYLIGNELTDVNFAALGKLARLETLNVAGNPLKQPVDLAPLSGLKSIRTLDVSFCSLTGPLPAVLDTLTTLTELKLGDNAFTGTIPNLGDLAELTQLSLGNNKLEGSVPAELGRLTKLRYLNLGRNGLSGSLPTELGNMTELRYLNAGTNRLSGLIPPSLGNLTNMQGLYLDTNELTGSVPAELGNLVLLEELSLFDNQLAGGFPASLGNLTVLRSLSLWGNQIGGSIPAEIGQLTQLEYLDLSGNQLTSLPSEIGQLVKLRYLFLDGNLIGGAIPKVIGNLTQLEDMNFQANKFTGAIPAEFGQLKKLRNLNLSFNQLTGTIPPNLGSMTALERLTLQANQLTGTIPSALGTMPSIVGIDLTKNSLSGAIPGELGNLSTLQGLYLGGNVLIGVVPSSLTKLQNLNDGYGMDLRWNALRTDDAALRDFINKKSYGFDETQTIAPPGLVVAVASTASVSPRWNPILYQSDGGNYEVLVQQGTGSAVVGATTTTKGVSSATVGGLVPGTTYSISLRTVTRPHENNPNTVVSEPSPAVTASTTAAGSVTVTLTPTSVRLVPGGNTNVTATIAPAAGPLDITLTSSNAQVATVPAKVTIGAGATSATFSVSGQRYGTTILTATLPASVGGGSAASDVTVAGSSCLAPDTPSFLGNPSAAPVRGGNAITLSWTPTLAQDPGGTYQLDVAPNADCRTGLAQYRVSQPTFTVPTRGAQTGTFCFVVRAFSSANCPSGDSSALSVTVQPGPASFVVGGTPSAVTTIGTAPDPTRVVFKNIGFQPATLRITANAAFVTASPTSFPNVAPGGTAEVTLAFDPLTTVNKGVLVGSICGGWTDGSAKTTCSAVTLTILSSPPSPSSTAARPEPLDTNEVHFITAPGQTPPAQFVTIKNPSSRSIRLAPSIGPGGTWLNILSGGADFATPIPPGGSRIFTFTVDRSKRATSDGAPPISTQLVLTNVDGPEGDRLIFQVFDEEPPPATTGANRPFLSGNDASLILGSSVNATGSGGTIFISDGWIRNKSGSAANADLYYTPGETDGIGNPQVKRASVTLQPYATYRLSDFVRGLFGTSGSGSVEIRSSGIADLAVRTTVDALARKGDNLVRFGAEIPTVRSREGAGVGKNGGASLLLPGLRGGAGSGSRTNVILTETSGRATTVALRLFGADGTKLSESNVTVLPYSKTQINASDTRVFPANVGIDGASLEVVPVSGAGSVAAFATVIDNASTGYTTRSGRFAPQSVLGSRPGKSPLATLTRIAIPTAAHASGKNNSFFTTTVSMTNGVGSPANLTLRYMVDGAAAAVKTVTIAPHATVNYGDIIASLFGITENSAGMIFVEGDVSKVVATSDTSTLLDPAQPAQGLSPSTLPGYAPESSYAIGDPKGLPSPLIAHPALEESSRFRTNLILAEVSGAATTVRVRIVPPGSGGVPLAEKEYTLGAYQRVQVNQFMTDIAGPGQYIDYETSVEWVSGAGRILAVATKIDNDPNSKRSDVYVLGPTGGLQGTIGY